MKRQFLIISVSAASVLAIEALAQDTFRSTGDRLGSAATSPAQPGSATNNVGDRDDRVATNGTSAAGSAVSNDRDRDDRGGEHRRWEHRRGQHRDLDDRVTTNGTSAAASESSNDRDRDHRTTTNATPGSATP